MGFLGDDLNGEFLEVHIVSTKMFNHPHTSCYFCVFFKWDLDIYSSHEIDPFLNMFLSKRKFLRKKTAPSQSPLSFPSARMNGAKVEKIYNVALKR